jgi:hypothetical protein
MRLLPTKELCVMTSDGVAVMVNSESLKVTSRQKLHKMPITSCYYLAAQKMLATASTDYQYRFVKTSQFSVVRSAGQWLLQFGILLVFLLLIANYLY